MIVLFPELISWRNPTSWFTGLEENTVLGSTSEVSIELFPDDVNPARVRAVGESIGSSSPSAANMFNKFSSRLGSESGIMVPGLEFVVRTVKVEELAGGCMDGMRR